MQDCHFLPILLTLSAMENLLYEDLQSHTVTSKMQCEVLVQGIHATKY